MITKNDYKTALTVQNACNLSGVVHSFSEIKSRIEGDTNERNTHPICKLFADKIADLAGVRTLKQYREAYEICLKEGKEIME